MNHKLSQDFESGETAGRSNLAGSVAGWLMRITGLAAILVLARPTDAWAYIDPSTGSYLLQMLLAGILAAAFAIRIFWHNLRLFFQRLFSGNRTDQTDEDQSTS